MEATHTAWKMVEAWKLRTAWKMVEEAWKQLTRLGKWSRRHGSHSHGLENGLGYGIAGREHIGGHLLQELLEHDVCETCDDLTLRRARPGKSRISERTVPPELPAAV